MKAFKMQWFNAIIMFLCFAENVDSLPVTSKPLDNTPEHLAWEAWIMVPQAHNKTRKITPKSIFILPNKATSPQVSCPPGYLIENSKCIQTVQIDSNAILLNHLANVLNSSTNYDFDYDYDEFEEPHSQMGEPDEGANDGPLKIDLLSPSAVEYSTRSDDDYISKSDENRGSQTSPLYTENTASATISTLSTIKTRTSERDVAATTVSTTTSVDQEMLTHDNIMPDMPLETLPESTPATSTTPFLNVPPKPNQSSVGTESITTIPQLGAAPTNVAPKDVTEFPSGYVEDAGEISAIKNDREVGFTQDDVATEMNGFTMEFEPSPDIPSEPKGEIFSHEVDKLNEANEPQKTYEVEKTVLPVYSITTETSVTSSDQSSTTTLTTLIEPLTVENKSENVTSTQKPLTAGMPEETEEIIDEQKNFEYGSNIQNRFVYQHFNKNFSNVEQSSSAIHVEEPLYTIRKIVEESKKQSEQTPMRGVGTLVKQSEVEETVHHISATSAVHGISSTRPPGLFASIPPLPALHDSTFLTPTLPWSAMRYPPTAVTPVRQNANPYSWLPSSWEVENNAEKPLLLRFWSRAIPTVNSANQAPTMHRENSRSPTENLYREISSQEFYKVLNARNSRLQSTSRFP